MTKKMGRPPGIPNPNAGRPRSVAKLRVGDRFAFRNALAAGMSTSPWTVQEVTADTVTWVTEGGVQLTAIRID